MIIIIIIFIEIAERIVSMANTFSNLNLIENDTLGEVACMRSDYLETHSHYLLMIYDNIDIGFTFSASWN